jgi:hypothetical protein
MIFRIVYILLLLNHFFLENSFSKAAPGLVLVLIIATVLVDIIAWSQIKLMKKMNGG